MDSKLSELFHLIFFNQLEKVSLVGGMDNR